MTEQFRLSESDKEDMLELARARLRTDAWIERVREADADAEARWQAIETETWSLADNRLSASLIAIAAELRAARIARRPGAGQ